MIVATLVAAGLNLGFGSLPVGVQIAIWTAFGGIALRLIEKWLNKNAEVISERADKRAEIKELRERLDVVEDALSETRQKLFSKEEEVAELRQQLIRQGHRPNQPSPRETGPSDQ